MSRQIRNKEVQKRNIKLNSIVDRTFYENNTYIQTLYQHEQLLYSK